MQVREILGTNKHVCFMYANSECSGATAHPIDQRGVNDDN